MIKCPIKQGDCRDANRDANLWRPKIGRLSFFLYPPPPEFQHPPPPPKIDPGPNGNDLEHYMTSYMMLHD